MAGTRGLYARMHAFHLPSGSGERTFKRHGPPNFQEARSASHECGTSSSADDDAGHACFASQHTRFSARARFPPGLAQREL